MTVDRVKKLIRKNIRIAGWVTSPKAWHGVVNGPKVLINSVPKCGTNLLQEIVQNIPMMRGTLKRTVYGTTTDDALNFVSNIKKGSCSTSHLYFSSELQEKINEHGVITFHLVRDFRDAIYSHIQFIDTLGIAHPHGNIFENVNTLDEKVDICLFGAPNVMAGWVETLNGFDGWRESNAMIVKYEDLLSLRSVNSKSNGKNNNILTDIAHHMGIDSIDSTSHRLIIEKSNDPKGLTFNNPGIEKWRKTFSTEQIENINNAIGVHLERYGYRVDS